MESDDCLLQNYYWVELKMEWDSKCIDLDESDSVAPNVCEHLNRCNSNRSVQNMCDSPYGIKTFIRKIKPMNCQSSQQVKKKPTIKRSIKYLSDRCKFVYNKYRNTFQKPNKRSINDEKTPITPLIVENSMSISDLSFDDTIVSDKCDQLSINYCIYENTSNSNKNVEVLNDNPKYISVKSLCSNLCQSAPPPVYGDLENTSNDKHNYEKIISMDSIYSNLSSKSNSYIEIDECFKVNLNDAIVNTSIDSVFNNTLETIGEYYSFALGAIHHNSSDFPTLNVNSLSFNDYVPLAVDIYDVNNNINFNLDDKHYQNHNLKNEFMNESDISMPPENDLQKNSADRVLSEHQLRVQRSLQKLNLPDWYKNSPVRPEGFLLKKRASDAGTSNRGWESSGLSSKTTSLGSLGGGVPLARSPLAITPPSQQLGFSRWSTSRLNSAQTSPCSSARSSIRGGAVSPLTSPARPPRAPRPTRAPYLGWRSQERLASPRTPHERLAVSLLPQSPQVPANVSDEIQTSIKEVTSAIVHYVSGLEPNQDRLNVDSDVRSTSPRGSPRLCWLESSFVGTKPLESPQTPVVVAQLSPPHQSQPQQRPLQLDLPSSRPAANGTVTLSTTTYQHDWHTSQHSLLNLAISKPSPGSTTLEDVLDSLLGLPPAVPRIVSPQNSPRRAPSPYYTLGLQTRYKEHNNSQTSSLQLNLSSKIDDKSSSEYHTPLHHSEDTYNSLEISQDGDLLNRRRSSAESSSCSTLAPGMDGADRDNNNSVSSLPKIRVRAKSAVSGKYSSRRQSEPATAPKSHSLDRRISYDSRISKGENNLSKTSLSDTPQSRASLKSITSINTDGSGEDTLVHCRYTKCTSATTQVDARRYYKNCHNCNYLYCSRECRRAHWEKHRKVCLHSRASTLCRQILSTAKEDADSLHHVSMIAQRGYLSQGRGVVKVFFTSPDAAEKFTANGFQNLGEPIYVKWPDLMPNEMGPELYAELVKLCKSYNPETRLVLYVAVCIVSEVPTKGAAVKWERQIVSRCAKLRLSNTVTSSTHGQYSVYSSPKAKIRSKDKLQKDKDTLCKTESTETLILTSNSANFHQKNNATVQKIREISFNNIQMQLQKRGVNLKKHYPEIHTKLCSYVEGTCDKFTPITIYPRDNSTGKLFMCVIMPETEPDKFQTLPNNSVECHTIDVSIDHTDQLSTPM